MCTVIKRPAIEFNAIVTIEAKLTKLFAIVQKLCASKPSFAMMVGEIKKEMARLTRHDKRLATILIINCLFLLTSCMFFILSIVLPWPTPTFADIVNIVYHQENHLTTKSSNAILNLYD